ncbi:hypothetical protein AMTRI_Chr10g227230 [Amborella trichopoda]
MLVRSEVVGFFIMSSGCLDPVFNNYGWVLYPLMKEREGVHKFSRGDFFFFPKKRKHNTGRKGYVLWVGLEYGNIIWNLGFICQNDILDFFNFSLQILYILCFNT